MPDDHKPPRKNGRHTRMVVVNGRWTTLQDERWRGRWHDSYHFLLTVPWSAFLALMGLAYFAANALFAALYLLQPQSLANAKAGSFWDAFFFSVQTLGTIGYGVMAPQTRYANTVAAIESFAGLLSLALVTGLIFARFSRPTARVMFSRNVVVTTFDGALMLMFRAANVRGNQILEADVSITLARNVLTSSGSAMRRLEELKAVRARSSMFALTWTVMHQIDATSPLHSIPREELAAEQAELIIVIGGTDEALAQRVHARHIYSANDILWDRRLADILTLAEDGRRIIDYSRFHDTEPDTASA